MPVTEVIPCAICCQPPGACSCSCDKCRPVALKWKITFTDMDNGVYPCSELNGEWILEKAEVDSGWEGIFNPGCFWKLIDVDTGFEFRFGWTLSNTWALYMEPFSLQWDNTAWADDDCYGPIRLERVLGQFCNEGETGNKTVMAEPYEPAGDACETAACPCIYVGGCVIPREFPMTFFFTSTDVPPPCDCCDNLGPGGSDDPEVTMVYDDDNQWWYANSGCFVDFYLRYNEGTVAWEGSHNGVDWRTDFDTSPCGNAFELFMMSFFSPWPGSPTFCPGTEEVCLGFDWSVAAPPVECTDFITRAAGPGLLRRVFNFGKSMLIAGASLLRGNNPKVPPEIAKERLDICKECRPYFDPNKQRCTHAKCGCYMPYKTTLAAMECPIGKWTRRDK